MLGVLKNTTDKVLSALSDNTEQLTTLISKIDSHDIRREYEAKERLEDKEDVAKLKEAVNQVNNRIDTYITDVAPIIAKSKSKQDSIDKFKDSMSTTGAKMFMVLIVVAIGAALGLDLSSIVK